jgi:hypothetical protein
MQTSESNASTNPVASDNAPANELPVIGYCRTCGKGLTQDTVHRVYGTLFCAEHSAVAAASDANPYQAAQPMPPLAPNPSVSPIMAFILGFIPGVGAIYNGEYAKGFLHVFVFGVLISLIESNGGAIFAIGLGIWTIYMAFEAYHTARARRDGTPRPAALSVFEMDGEMNRYPILPIVLIGAGVLFLLDNLNLINFDEVARFWPVLLIAAGVALLLVRTREQSSSGNSSTE